MKKKLIGGLAALLSIITLALVCMECFPSNAASSYTNAKEYYDSIEACDYKTEYYDGSIYYGTKAKTAASGSTLKYFTIGFDVTLEAGGYSLTFTVKRDSNDSPGGSMVDISTVSADDGCTYNLYCIPYEDIIELAYAKNSTKAGNIFKNTTVQITLDNIVTTKKLNTSTGTWSLQGDIEEDGEGGFTQTGTIYRLINESTDLEALRNIFVGHYFYDYYNIPIEMAIYTLSITYDVNGASTGNSNFSIVNDMLYKNGSIRKQTYTTFQKVDLINYNGNPALTKTGYHMESGKEWVYNDVVFDQTIKYNPKYIDKAVGLENVDVVMTANWQPNEYTVKYNANGGSGNVYDQEAKYGTAFTLRKNTYTRTGYQLVEGKEWKTTSGTTSSTVYYESYQSNVKNLTTEHGGEVTLYANWTPVIYTITCNPTIGSGGTSTFREWYGTKFMGSSSTSTISSIYIPSKTGYTFKGYYTKYNGEGDAVIDENGKIVAANTLFTKDTTIYAYWEKNSYTITFNKNGGSGGTDNATAVYGETYPLATAPTKSGYTFLGYYASANTTSTLWYSQYMVPNGVYNYTVNKTIYAMWQDTTPPTVSLNVAEEWSRINRTVKYKAYDKQDGLDKVILKRNGEVLYEHTNLNGQSELEISITHSEQGIYTYELTAYDMEGSYDKETREVKIDKTPPVGYNASDSDAEYPYTINNRKCNNFSVEIDAYDPSSN